MKISVIVVALNAGSELKATVKSIVTQTYKDIEIIVKDGGSTDGSVEGLPSDDRIRLTISQDLGIYDAMNQALELATGDYVYFLNCGDYLFDEYVIEKTVKELEKSISGDGSRERHPLVIYGDIYDRIADVRVTSNPQIDEFACYRNVPCHQACIYDREMLLCHPFRTEYRVRADYEQFLWCYFIAKAKTVYMDEIMASYMCGGFSESRANKRVSKREHAEIVKNYMSPQSISKYKWRMRLSMAGLRGLIARNPVTAGAYNKLKTVMYNKRK